MYLVQRTSNRVFAVRKHTNIIMKPTNRCCRGCRQGLLLNSPREGAMSPLSRARIYVISRGYKKTMEARPLFAAGVWICNGTPRPKANPTQEKVG